MLIRRGSVWELTPPTIRLGSNWQPVEISLVRVSSLFVQSPVWQTYQVTAAAEPDFRGGADKNSLTATPNTSGYHTASKTFSVVPGSRVLFAFLVAPGNSNPVGFDLQLFNAGNFLFSSGFTRFNPNNFSAGIDMVSRPDGIFHCFMNYNVPNNINSVEARIVLLNGASDVFTSSGEKLLISDLTLLN